MLVVVNRGGNWLVGWSGLDPWGHEGGVRKGFALMARNPAHLGVFPLIHLNQGWQPRVCWGVVGVYWALYLLGNTLACSSVAIVAMVDLRYWFCCNALVCWGRSFCDDVFSLHCDAVFCNAFCIVTRWFGTATIIEQYFSLASFLLLRSRSVERTFFLVRVKKKEERSNAKATIDFWLFIYNFFFRFLLTMSKGRDWKLNRCGSV